MALDPKTLPEFYFPMEPLQVSVHVEIGQPAPSVSLTIEKREPQLPRRQVIRRPLPEDPPKKNDEKNQQEQR